MINSKNKSEMIALGQWLKECRERSRIPISEIAEALHIDPIQVMQLESGRFDEKMLKQLSDIYRVPYEVVLIKLHNVRRRQVAKGSSSDSILLP